MTPPDQCERLACFVQPARSNRRHRYLPLRARFDLHPGTTYRTPRPNGIAPNAPPRTERSGASGTPVPDPVLPCRSTARRSAQVVKLRQNDDTVLCGGRPIPPVRRSDAFMAPAQGRQRSPGAMPSPASSSGIERLAAAVSTGFAARVPLRDAACRWTGRGRIGKTVGRAAPAAAA